MTEIEGMLFYICCVLSVLTMIVLDIRENLRKKREDK